MGPYYRFEERIHAKEEENLSLVHLKRERGSKRVYLGIDKKGI